MIEYIAIYIIIMNIAGFLLCAFDKRAAVKNRSRISERTLFGVALLGGSLGLYTAMLIIRHKTRKLSFIILMPVIIILQAVVLFCICRKF